MKTKILLFSAFILSLSACNTVNSKKSAETQMDSTSTKTEQKIEFEQIWSTDTVLTTVESLKYDADNKYIYAANINGNPTEKDGNGFISKLDTLGNIENLHWIDGLDAPKGMGIIGNSLFVTNIDEIVEIDITKGEIIQKIIVPGAQFLNDIDVDEQNNSVFVSDMATNKIHLLKNGNLSVYSQDTTLHKVNGLYFYKNELLAGTENGVFIIKPDGTASEYINHLGGIDGLEFVAGNKFIVSNWSGAVNIIEKGEKAILLFDTSNDKINAADIDYIPQKNILLVPTFFDNRAVAYKLKFN